MDIPDDIPNNLDIDNLKTISVSLETEDIPDNIPSNLETIKTFKDIEIPSIDNLATDAPKKLKIISNPNSLRMASNKIKKKYIRQKSKGKLKKINKKVAKHLQNANYLDTDNLEMVDYNNDNNIDDFDDDVTVDYNFNNNLKGLDEIDLKKTSPVKKLAAKKIVKKYRNLARKKPYQKFSSKKKQRDDDNDVAFLKKSTFSSQGKISQKNKRRS